MSDAPEEQPPFNAAPPWSESTVVVHYAEEDGKEIAIDPAWTMRYASSPPVVGDLVRVRRLGRSTAETYLVKMRTWGSNPRASVCPTVAPFDPTKGA